jgi:predicted Zn-ribbon and HTH transcriptional regulator
MVERAREYDRIRTVLAEADPDEPLTASEILQLLEASDEQFDSPHRVATVLGRRAREGEVTVIRSSPYRYRLDPSSASGSGS